MADAGKEDEDFYQEDVSVEEGVSGTKERHSFLPAGVDESTHSTLLTIAQGVPNVWPADLKGEREEFSSICIAGGDFEPSNSTEGAKVSLRLCNRAIWRAIGCHEMKIFIRKDASRIFPTLTASVEGLKADEIYTFFLDLMPKNQNIYADQSGRWIPQGSAKPYPPPNQTEIRYLFTANRSTFHVIILCVI
ncbi:T-box brain protein 1 [Taenia crassiceps]|uniref:T-box brain protein 1 n=1 Tax=Taenia crassiceps TaxID=6207 RepID=A0ABR4PZE7_9CEST